VQNSIVLVWIYTHEEFEGRPDEKSLTATLQDAIDSLPDETNLSTNTEEQATYPENSSSSNQI
jgi:hypothetical protein